jgi:hypothetical protein
MPIYIATATMKGTQKSGKLHERWRDEVEEDLNVMGIRNRHAIFRGHHKGRKIVLKTKVHNRLQFI